MRLLLLSASKRLCGRVCSCEAETFPSWQVRSGETQSFGFLSIAGDLLWAACCEDRDARYDSVEALPAMLPLVHEHRPRDHGVGPTSARRVIIVVPPEEACVVYPMQRQDAAEFRFVCPRRVRDRAQ